MKFFYLHTCSTCTRIAKELDIENRGVELREIKTSPVTASELDDMRSKAGSYEALFNKRSRKYREMKLGEKELSEDQIRELILGEYTFLKRPVLVADEIVFAGNSKKVVAEALQFIRDAE